MNILTKNKLENIIENTCDTLNNSLYTPEFDAYNYLVNELRTFVDAEELVEIVNRTNTINMKSISSLKEELFLLLNDVDLW